MAQEFESPGSEYHLPKQRREADELRAPAPETTAPAGELGIDRKSSENARERKEKQKEKQQKHHKLLKKMVYAAASAVAVVGLSQSVGTQSAGTQSVAVGTPAVRIGTDGIFLLYESEDESENGIIAWPQQTFYYYFFDYEISENTVNAVNSYEGYDFEYEVTYLPMSALEDREDLSFDEKTYTLTLRDYCSTILVINIYDANENDELTIRLEGINELGNMWISGTENVIFTGTGSLKITGISEFYNVTTETYEELDTPFSNYIYIYGRTTEEGADEYTKVFVDEGCSLTADSLNVCSYVPFLSAPVSGYLQWTSVSETEYEKSDGTPYYYYHYDNITPLEDNLSNYSSTTNGEIADANANIVEAETTHWLIARGGITDDVFGNENLTKEQIISITFLDNLEEMPSGAWDASDDGSGAVMAWVIAVGTADGNDIYDLYIACEGGVKANPNSRHLFYLYRNVEEIHFDGNLDTSNVTDMSVMFGICESLTSLDLSSFNTSNVSSMWDMFSGCESLVSVNLSGFDTSNVEDMRTMFSRCGNLASLDLSNFDTSNVMEMRFMFYSCESLNDLDLSSFEVSNVTDMYGMFEGCVNLSSLEGISSWNTMNVTNMNALFCKCSSLVSLDLSRWNTSSVTNMDFMFYMCENLTDLNISNFDMSSVTSSIDMFTGTQWE